MFKEILVFFMVLGGLVILSMGIKILFFPVNTATKLIDTAYQAQDKVLNADNAIYNYEWFKQQYEDIEATKSKLVNARAITEQFKEDAGDRSLWTFEDKTESARLSSVVLGLENHLEQQIADYNARSKMATRNIFVNSVLPSYIDALSFIGR